jgi:hypothetical protein
MTLKKTTLLVAACSVLMVACAKTADTQKVNIKEYQEPILSAKWINYQCEAGQGGPQTQARYYFGEATAFAQVKLGEQILTMDYDGEQSNPETTVFSVDNYSWSITNQYTGKSPELENNGFLTLNKTETVNGTQVAVSEILKKSCFPVK